MLILAVFKLDPCSDGPGINIERSGFTTLAFSGSPCWVKINTTPCRLGVPIVGKDQHGYITPAFLGVPMVGIDQSGYINPCLLGGPDGRERSKWLHNPCLLGGPHGREGSKWLHNPCLLGDTQLGDKIRSGYTNSAFLGATGKKKTTKKYQKYQKYQKKKLSILSIYTWGDLFY